MTRIFIVEDHAVVVEGIRVLLESEPGITIAGSSYTAAGCIDYFANHKADVVLMDISLPDMSGIELCRIIKAGHKEVMVLMLSTFNQGLYMNKAMEQGASGYLLKNVTRQEMIDGIKTVSMGGVYFSFEAGKIYKSTLEKNSLQPVLTKREKEILKLVVEGLTNTQISQQLFISIDTVDTHRKNLYAKLNVKNTAQLIRYTLEHGIIS
ncbi:MAG: response regulator transcription factor [Bacteroidota bacterium]|nr:response regulator transcription factor [Bacteroidota bacterium]MDP4213485.1 response regulator transcription factor [Bacteroidota bacterium]MDP4250112.1 response regulator transcription factor [Bacteroidota bacterium]